MAHICIPEDEGAHAISSQSTWLLGVGGVWVWLVLGRMMSFGGLVGAMSSMHTIDRSLPRSDSSLRQAQCQDQMHPQTHC